MVEFRPEPLAHRRPQSESVALLCEPSLKLT
jgi:hypothetical protein